MSKFHISTQILQGNALFSGKIYTAGIIFTRPPVATVATNFKSGLKYIDDQCRGPSVMEKDRVAGLGNY